MTGLLVAAVAGVGFGLFQVVNNRAVALVDDVWFSTFLQLLFAGVVLVAGCVVTGEVSYVSGLNARAWVCFGIAGLLHFFFAWTLLNTSQARIGAARTSPLLATVPLWALVVAAATLGQVPTPAALVGVAVMVCGALTLSSPKAMAGVQYRDLLFALGTASLWAVSPVFTLEGLDEVDAPLLGATVGLVVAAIPYGMLMLASAGRRQHSRSLPWAGINLKLLGGAIAGLATWGRWAALDLSPVSVVLALNLLSVPVVLALAPLVGAGSQERVGVRTWLGGGLVVGGAAVLILAK